MGYTVLFDPETPEHAEIAIYNAAQMLADHLGVNIQEVLQVIGIGNTGGPCGNEENPASGSCLAFFTQLPQAVKVALYWLAERE